MSKNKNETELVVLETEPAVLEPVVDGPPHGVLIKLTRPVSRADIKAGVNDIIAEIIIAEGCGDVNFVVDAIRNGFAGEA